MSQNSSFWFIQANCCWWRTRPADALTPPWVRIISNGHSMRENKGQVAVSGLFMWWHCWLVPALSSQITFSLTCRTVWLIFSLTLEKGQGGNSCASVKVRPKCWLCWIPVLRNGRTKIQNRPRVCIFMQINCTAQQQKEEVASGGSGATAQQVLPPLRQWHLALRPGLIG